MGDLPEAPALLALARDVLVNDLLPLLPAERRLDARLVANCMAIAEREAAADGRGGGIRRAGGALQRDCPYPPSSAAPSLPRTRERVPSAGGGEGRAERGGEVRPSSRRLARELRIGAFENSPERAARARAILWRLTIAGLRLANPRFLAANGFA